MHKRRRSSAMAALNIALQCWFLLFKEVVLMFFSFFDLCLHHGVEVQNVKGIEA